MFRAVGPGETAHRPMPPMMATDAPRRLLVHPLGLPRVGLGWFLQMHSCYGGENEADRG